MGWVGIVRPMRRYGHTTPKVLGTRNTIMMVTRTSMWHAARRPALHWYSCAAVSSCHVAFDVLFATEKILFPISSGAEYAGQIRRTPTDHPTLLLNTTHPIPQTTAATPERRATTRRGVRFQHPTPGVGRSHCTERKWRQ